jgi:uncharacterized protein
VNEPRGRGFARKSRFNISLSDSFYRVIARRRAALAALVCVFTFLGGCTKKTLSKAQAREVTAEIVAATQQATARKSEITIRPEAATGGLLARRAAVDDIYVTLSDPAQLVPLRRSLSDIARRHRLTIEESATGGVERLNLASDGTRTHTVHVVTPVGARTRAVAASRDSSAGGNGPRLAIILDDLGYERAAANAALALPFSITVSVLPNLPLSTEVAEEAYRRGDEVLLHLPMESESNDAKPEPIELRVGMNAQEVEGALAGMLESVPHAVGVNNHQGSRATSDAALMNELMPALRGRNLFFIDSRTTAATVAYGAAEHAGVRAASRKVFLDDTQTREAILAQLDLAARDAARDGFAIAIGHPHPATIEALTEGIPRAEARGVRLVFVSQVVR